MRANLTIVLLVVSAFAAASALADDGAVIVSVKRQMVLCMSKRMAVNKALSYNDAERECKQNLASRNPVATTKRALTANAVDTPALKTP